MSIEVKRAICKRGKKERNIIGQNCSWPGYDKRPKVKLIFRWLMPRIWPIILVDAD